MVSEPATKMDSGELAACDVDRSRSFLHSSFIPHRRAIDALDASLRPIVRREPQELFPYKYNEDLHSATTPAFLASIPEIGGFIAADLARRRPRRIDHPTRAEFLGSTGELRPCCWSAHPSPVGDYPTSPLHRAISDQIQGEFELTPNFSCFDGESWDEDYLEWEQEVDYFFYYACVPPEKQVRCVIRKLKGRAKTWWALMRQARHLEGRSDVKTWRKMKRLLRDQFLTLDYEALLDQQHHTHLQDFHSVNILTGSDEFFNEQLEGVRETHLEDFDKVNDQTGNAYLVFGQSVNTIVDSNQNEYHHSSITLNKRSIYTLEVPNQNNDAISVADNGDINTSTSNLEKCVEFCKEERIQDAMEAFLLWVKRGVTSDISRHLKLLQIITDFKYVGVTRYAHDYVFTKIHNILFSILSKVLMWFGEMYKKGEKNNEVIIGTVVRVYIKDREFCNAEDYFKWWSSSTDSALQVQNNYSQGLDTTTFNTMNSICGNYERFEEVSSLVEMKEEVWCHPDTRTYNIIISLYVKYDDVTQATSCFKKMNTTNLVPDTVSYRIHLYIVVVCCLIQVVESIVLVLEKNDLEIDEYTHAALTRMCVKIGKCEQSLTCFEEFCDKMSSECDVAHADSFGERGAWFLVEKLLTDAELPHKVVAFVRSMLEAGLVSNHVPFYMVINNYFKLSEVRRAEVPFTKMIKVGLQPNTIILSVCINIFMEVGRAQEAASYIELMKSMGRVPNSTICNSFIKLSTKIISLQELEKTYKLAKSPEAEEKFHYLQLSGETSEFLYPMMLCLYKKMGKFDEAYKLAQEMHDLSLMSDALSHSKLFGVSVVDQRMKEALKIFRQILVTDIKSVDATFRNLGIIMLKTITFKLGEPTFLPKPGWLMTILQDF